jgi:hypothetical protein
MSARSTPHEAAIRREAIADPRGVRPERAPRTQLHILWRQFLGLVAWAGVMAFLVMGPMVATLLIVLGGVALADLWQSVGQGRPGAKARSRRRPLAMRIAKALLIVVAYPAFLLGLANPRTLEGADDFYWALVVFGGIAYLWFIGLGVASALAQTAI